MLILIKDRLLEWLKLLFKSFSLKYKLSFLFKKIILGTMSEKMCGPIFHQYYQSYYGY